MYLKLNLFFVMESKLKPGVSYERFSLFKKHFMQNYRWTVAQLGNRIGFLTVKHILNFLIPLLIFLFFFFGFGFSFLKTLFTICIYSCSRAEADCHLETDPEAAGTAFLPSSINVRDKSLFTAIIRYPRSDIGCPSDTRYQIGGGRG